MFEVPEAKRIRRDELLSDSSSDSSLPNGHDSEDDEYSRQQLRERLGRQLGLDFVFEQPGPTASRPRRNVKGLTPRGKRRGDEAESSDAEEEGEQEGEEEFEFRLFASTSESAPGKVALRGENEISNSEGTILAKRPLSYYVPGPAMGEQLERFALAAVTAECVLQWARQRSWGLEMPWRVTTIASTGITPTTMLPHKGLKLGGGKEVADKKKRPGKKSRIAMRKRAKAREEKLVAAEKQKEEKEEHLKEKKKRMNRLKKLRKRAKKKAGKEEEDVEDEDEGAENDVDE